MLNTVTTKGRAVNEKAVDKTLAITLPLRSAMKNGDTSLSFEDVQEAFGGDRPADVLRNVFNYAIQHKLAE
jgi:hypothetical protein